MLQPKPFELLKTVVRKYPKLDRMYDNGKRDEYERINKASRDLREDSMSLKANTVIDFNIRLKNLESAIYSIMLGNWSSEWFKVDQLEYGNNILKQFDTAINLLLDSDEIISHEVESLKEARDDYITWLETHKGMISFTYVLHNKIKPYFTDDIIIKNDESLTEILDLIISECVKLSSAVESVKMITMQRDLLAQDREAKLIVLQTKINKNGEWK